MFGAFQQDSQLGPLFTTFSDLVQQKDILLSRPSSSKYHRCVPLLVGVEIVEPVLAAVLAASEHSFPRGLEHAMRHFVPHHLARLELSKHPRTFCASCISSRYSSSLQFLFFLLLLYISLLASNFKKLSSFAANTYNSSFHCASSYVIQALQS